MPTGATDRNSRMCRVHRVALHKKEVVNNRSCPDLSSAPFRCLTDPVITFQSPMSSDKRRSGCSFELC